MSDTTTLSFRLDSTDAKRFRAKAAALGVKPSDLARTLILKDLNQGTSDDVQQALSRLEQAVSDVRRRQGIAAGAIMAVTVAAPSERPSAEDVKGWVKKNLGEG
jgi:hypothetical protein